MKMRTKKAVKAAPSNYQRVRNQMIGVTELRKQDIDKLLRITGMSYERLFHGGVDNA